MLGDHDIVYYEIIPHSPRYFAKGFRRCLLEPSCLPQYSPPWSNLILLILLLSLF